MPLRLRRAPSAAAAAARSGRPRRRCRQRRSAHVGTRNGLCLGTALRKVPACACDTAMKRTASRAETAWRSVRSLSHEAWWITEEKRR